MAVDKEKNIENHPQAKDDAFAGGENATAIIDVMANDLGGNGKSLYSVHQTSPATVATTGVSAMGAQISIVGGKVVYAANSASINALAQGETAVDTFTYVIQMGKTGALSTATVSVTVTGTNDAPVVTGVVTGSAVEDEAGVTLNALANASDVDAGTVLNAVDVPASLPAGVSFDAAADTFTLDPAVAAYQSLGLGQTITVTVHYGVSDGITITPASVSWIVTGTNDGPVAVADTGAAVEDGGAVVVDVLGNDTDVDSGDTRTLVSVDATGTVGAVSANPDGTVTYDPGANFQSLGLGQTATDTFSYTIRDAAGATSTATVTMTVTGTNDGPVAVADVVSTTEDLGPLVIGLLGNDTDVDTLDTRTLVSIDATGTVGAVAVNPDGTVTYDAGSSFQTLGAGQTATDSFSYTMRDAAGATSTATVTVNIGGQNDAPVVTGPVTGAAVEGGASSFLNALANASDVDAGTVLTVTGLPSPLPAGVSFNAGTGAFTLDPSHPAYNSLAQGQTTNVGLSYLISDGIATTPAQVSWTVTGTNDTPTAAADTFSTFEDVPVVINVTGNDTDPDQGAVLGVTHINNMAIAVNGAVGVGAGGVVRLNADGTLTYTPGVNDNGARGFNYTVSDQHGATSTAQVNGTVTPVNDAPVAGDDTGIRPSLVNNSDFGSNLSGWTTNNGPTSGNFTSYSGSANWLSSFDNHQGVARLTLSGWINAGGGSGYGPTLRSDTFTASAGDTVSFDWRLSSGGDWALGNGYIKDAATGQIVATVFNFNQGQSGDTGWRHTDVALATGGSFYMEFQVGSYDSTFGMAVGATMYLDFAGVLPQIHEDAVLTINGSELLANDTDIDSTGLTLASVVGVSALGATVVLNADGTISYDPRTALNHLNAGESVVDTVTYTVRDAGGATDIGQATFTVQGRNDPELVQFLSNASFEENPPNGAVQGFSQIAGWTNNNGTLLEICDTTVYGVGGDGHWLDTQGTPGGINISQSVDLAAGQAATLSVSVAKVLTSGGLHPGSTLTFNFNGQVVLTLNESSFSDWNELQTFDVAVTGRAGADILTIQDSGGGQVGYALDWATLEGWVL